MDTHWQYTPGSKQHWLYEGRTLPSKRILGMVYEVNPAAFTVYVETSDAYHFAQREWVAELPTLQEAKDLLVTIANSRERA